MRKPILLLTLIIFLVAACQQQKTESLSSSKEENVPVVSFEDVSSLTPEQVVTLYFQAWNNEQYDVMYSLISDGFKQIDPQAKTFEDFKANMEKFYDTSIGIRIIEAKEDYINEKEAGINYKIEIANKDNTKKEFSSTYTLRKRTNGWKLIHPYGKNIDTA